MDVWGRRMEGGARDCVARGGTRPLVGAGTPASFVHELEQERILYIERPCRGAPKKASGVKQNQP